MSAKPFSQIAKECAKIKKQFAITKLNLRERRKELNGIYRIFGILNRPHKSKNINYITILNVITRSFLYKEICAARLILEGKEYKTANFKITPWRLSSAVHFRNKRIGRLDVYYLKKTEKIYKGPFLKEEIDFLSSI